MNFKITKCVHVTATERRHLSVFLDSGQTEAQVNTKIYTLVESSSTFRKIRISSPKRNDFGSLYYDHQTIELVISK